MDNNRKFMLNLSKEKMVFPYELEENLTLYCPQENLEAVDLPLIKNHLYYMLNDYIPPISGSGTILLLLPCTKAKPYTISAEHKYINRFLFEEGFEPVSDASYPQELKEIMGEQEEHLLNNGILKRNNTYIHRMVISDLPTVLVPYEYIYYYRDDFSIFSRYDDPGLFEHRGNTVCVWREDCSGVKVGKKYRWGPLEKAAYVRVHNIHAEAMAGVLSKLKGYYDHMLAYVTPKMTHRSFLADTSEKKEVGLPVFRNTVNGREHFIGVNDLHPSLVKIIPSQEELHLILDNLRKRLGFAAKDLAKAKAYFATGGGIATGLILPESLSVLANYLHDR